MKTILTIVSILIYWSGQSQEKQLSTPTPCFTAIIVNDINSAVAWYTDVLGVKEISRNTKLSIGLEQVNLKRESIQIELIYLKSAINSNNLVSKKQRLTGLFKIGFRLENFDQWTQRLKIKNILHEQDIVVDPISKKRMFVIKDPDGNRIQFFEA